MSESDQLRGYGPGKFNFIVDQAMYFSAGDGCDLEAGSVPEIGHWHGFLKDPWMTTPDVEDLKLTEYETDFLIKQKAAILTEDSNGFVDVEYYDCLSDAMTRWEEIETGVEEEMSDAEA